MLTTLDHVHMSLPLSPQMITEAIKIDHKISSQIETSFFSVKRFTIFLCVIFSVMNHEYFES